MSDDKKLGFEDGQATVMDMYAACVKEPIPDGGIGLFHQMMDGMFWGGCRLFDTAYPVFAGGAREKRILLLAGGSGTGKSAFVKAIGATLLRRIVTVSAREVLIHGDDLLEQVAMTGQKNCILLFDGVGHAGPEVLRLLYLLSDPASAITMHDVSSGSTWDASACVVMATIGEDCFPPPLLLDRCVLLPFSSFSAVDKAAALKECVIPRTIESMRLTGKLAITDEAINIIASHTSAAGGLKGATWAVEHLCKMMADTIKDDQPTTVGAKETRDILCLPTPIPRDPAEACTDPGCVNTIATTSISGGEPVVINIHAILSDGPAGLDVLCDCDKTFLGSCTSAYRLAAKMAEDEGYEAHGKHVTLVFSNGGRLTGSSCGTAVAMAVYSAMIDSCIPFWVAFICGCSPSGVAGKVDMVDHKVAVAEEAGCFLVVVAEEDGNDARVGSTFCRIAEIGEFDDIFDIICNYDFEYKEMFAKDGGLSEEEKKKKKNKKKSE